MDGIPYFDPLGASFVGIQPIIHTVDMIVYFENIMLYDDCVLETVFVQNTPLVVIGGQPNEFYTLVMFTPKARDPNEQQFRHHISWIVTNIAGGATSDHGIEFASYVGPNPEIGIHRYTLLLYKQQAPLNDMEPLTSRSFHVDDFANKHNLEEPVGLAFFNVRKQSD